MLLSIRKSTSFVDLLIPTCLFQFYSKYRNTSIIIQNTYAFVGKYPKINEKLNTSIWHYADVKRKSSFLNMGKLFLRQSFGHPPLPSSCALARNNEATLETLTLKAEIKKTIWNIKFSWGGFLIPSPFKNL